MFQYMMLLFWKMVFFKLIFVVMIFWWLIFIDRCCFVGDQCIVSLCCLQFLILRIGLGLARLLKCFILLLAMIVIWFFIGFSRCLFSQVLILMLIEGCSLVKLMFFFFQFVRLVLGVKMKIILLVFVLFLQFRYMFSLMEKGLFRLMG